MSNYPDDMGSRLSDYSDPLSPLYTGHDDIDVEKENPMTTETSIKNALRLAKHIIVDKLVFAVEDVDPNEMHMDSESTCIWLVDVKDDEADVECYTFEDIMDAHTHGIIEFFGQNTMKIPIG